MKRIPLFVCTLALLLLMALAFLLTPYQSFSSLENRLLARMPGASALLDGQLDEQLEAYCCDHFPLHDALISLRTTLLAATGERSINGVLIGSDGWLFEQPVGSVTANARYALDTLEELCSATGLPVTLLLIESSAQAVPDKLPPLAIAANQADVIDSLYAEADRVQTLTSSLSTQPRGEALYYRTDHHLTADGAQIVYEQLCAAWELTPIPAQRLELSGFLGSYYARAPLLSLKPETMTASLPEGLSVVIDGEARDSLIDEAALSRRNKYACLIGETYGHVQLTGGAEQGSLLILCDSYANAIAPLLAQHFQRTDLVDPRYYAGDVAALCREAGTQQVLVLMGLNTFSTNRGLITLDIGGNDEQTGSVTQ